MPDLTEDMKHAIVKGHAQFASPPDIRKLLSEEYGVDVDVRQIYTYDPRRQAFDAGERWRALFDDLRKVYMTEITSHDIASPAYRIGMLDKMAKRAEKSGNMKLAADLFEQAAKEVGGAFTNERKLTGTIDHRHRPATIDDARAELAERMRALQASAAKSGQDVAYSSNEGGDAVRSA